MKLEVVLTVLLMLSPVAVADGPPDEAEEGLERACENTPSQDQGPCRHVNVIPNTTVGPGETQTYEDDEYQAEGTIVVEDNGTVVIDNATINFEDSSDGIIVESGGNLLMGDCLLQEDEGGSDFEIDVAPLATFEMTFCTLSGGEGIDLATNDTLFDSNDLEDIPLALHLLDVTVDITNATFQNNTVAVNETGGSPTLEANLFDGGLYCVRNWRTNPTILLNTFRGCHFGIYHEQSHSTIEDNDLVDDGNEPGAGIYVQDTNSPVIENNTISNYSVGILIEDARASIRNNTVFDNVDDGIRVLRNSGPMDIRWNNVTTNGADGISLHDTDDIEVRGNDVVANGDNGIWADQTTNLRLLDNLVTDNADTGVFLNDAPGTLVEDTRAIGNGLEGFLVSGPSDESVLRRNLALDNGDRGITVHGDGAILEENNATGNDRGGYAVVGDNATLSDNVALTNAFIGFHVSADGWTLDSNLAQGNDLSGFRYHASDGLSTGNLALDNVDTGFEILGTGATLMDDVSRSNEDGFVFGSTVAINGTRLTASNNDLTGIYVHDATSESARGVLVDVNASDNGGNGLLFEGERNMGPVILDGPIVRDNGADGVLSLSGNTSTAFQGWFEGNADDGVDNDDPDVNSTLDYRNNYWGSPTGPTHEDNPNGNGDEVEGHVIYKPFLTEPPS